MSAAIYSFYEEGYVTESNVNKSSSVTKLSIYPVQIIRSIGLKKNYEKLLPALAVLAKKFLSVQASSASCERMFSIAGHIF